MERKQEKPRSTWSWVFEFAGMRKRDYVLSVIFAVCKVLCIIAPYIVLAEVIRELFAGNGDILFYVRDLCIMAALWVASAIFHMLSTSASHKATFYVLGSMRKRACDKLTRQVARAVGKRMRAPSRESVSARMQLRKTLFDWDLLQG